ncbi:hypothetical protein M8494_04620 [Serratia ureilytica]
MDIGTRHHSRRHGDGEKSRRSRKSTLLDGVTALLDVTSDEVRGIVIPSATDLRRRPPRRRRSARSIAIMTYC